MANDLPVLIAAAASSVASPAQTHPRRPLQAASHSEVPSQPQPSIPPSLLPSPANSTLPETNGRVIQFDPTIGLQRSSSKRSRKNRKVQSLFTRPHESIFTSNDSDTNGARLSTSLVSSVSDIYSISPPNCAHFDTPLLAPRSSLFGHNGLKNIIVIITLRDSYRTNCDTPQSTASQIPSRLGDAFRESRQPELNIEAARQDANAGPLPRKRRKRNRRKKRRAPSNTPKLNGIEMYTTNLSHSHARSPSESSSPKPEIGMDSRADEAPLLEPVRTDPTLGSERGPQSGFTQDHKDKINRFIAKLSFNLGPNDISAIRFLYEIKVGVKLDNGTALLLYLTSHKLLDIESQISVQRFAMVLKDLGFETDAEDLLSLANSPH